MTPWEARLRQKLQPPQGGPLPDLKPLSSVLMPIGWNQTTNQDEIVLLKRTMTVFTHKGQVACPGGFHEPGDVTILDTALRETWEEIGMEAENIQVLGALTPVKTLKDIWIYPWVGRVELPYDFTLNPNEVDRLLFLPLQRLLSEGVPPVIVDVGEYQVKSQGITIDGELCWGATARMLDELRGLLL